MVKLSRLNFVLESETTRECGMWKFVVSTVSNCLNLGTPTTIYHIVSFIIGYLMFFSFTMSSNKICVIECLSESEEVQNIKYGKPI